ncbi:MAG: creatininase family protein, partial [Nocardioidaceae bacterium]
LGTDWTIAHRLALSAGRMLSPHALVVPPFPYGLSAHHMGFAGTITIGFESFRSVCRDVVRSLHAHGVERFVFVNGHRGNESALSVMMTELRTELGVDIASAFWMTQARDVIEKHRRTKRWGHACEIETSLAMALAPELVHTEALCAGETIDEYRSFEDNYEPFALSVPLTFAERTRNGAFGDATLASREVGEEIAAVATDRLVAFARDLLTSHPRP